MALATTSSYNQLVLEISEDSGSTWSRICGIGNFSISRTANVETTEVPDCDDESLPHGIERDVRSTEMTVSGDGVWAQESHNTMIDWFKLGTKKDCRLGYLNADTGDVKYDTGNAILASLEHSRSKGQKVTASIELQFTGTLTETNA